MAHFYVGIEDLGLTAGQRQTLVDILQRLGQNSDPQPCKRNHWRVRLDNKAVIFEAEFGDYDWSDETLALRLADIFSVPIANITHTHPNTSYGVAARFSYLGNPKLQGIIFGGLGATWEQSREACLQYLKDNAADWELQV